MAFRINPFSKDNPDTGFGTSQIGGRFINKDGSFNLRKEGWPIYKRNSIYSYLLAVQGFQFVLNIVSQYLLVNVLFTLLYISAGFDELQGLTAGSSWEKTKEVFFFSTQTFTTVGYGRINPVGDGANIIAAFESLTALMAFAIVTG